MTAITTVPTGFVAVPPPGPAMPVMPTRDVGPGPLADPLGHRDRHRLADGAVLAISVRAARRANAVLTSLL